MRAPDTTVTLRPWALRPVGAREAMLCKHARYHRGPEIFGFETCSVGTPEDMQVTGVDVWLEAHRSGDSFNSLMPARKLGELNSRSATDSQSPAPSGLQLC